MGARAEGGFPWATFAANISGAFLLGLLMGSLLNRPEGNDAYRLFLGVGVLGGYTTFSTLAFDTVDLFYEGAGAVALANSLGSLVAGLIAAVAGLALARAL